MKLVVERAWPKATYTIGRLFVDGERFYETLEDKDRMLFKDDPLPLIRRTKVYGETAIPKGKYEVRMDIVSPKYAAVTWFNTLCGGRMPRLMNVPGFDGVLIHPGNSAIDTLGCILVGRNTKVGQLTSSRDTFKALYRKMEAAWKRGEKITIEIR